MANLRTVVQTNRDTWCVMGTCVDDNGLQANPVLPARVDARVVIDNIEVSATYQAGAALESAVTLNAQDFDAAIVPPPPPPLGVLSLTDEAGFPVFVTGIKPVVGTPLSISPPNGIPLRRGSGLVNLLSVVAQAGSQLLLDYRYEGHWEPISPGLQVPTEISYVDGPWNVTQMFDNDIVSFFASQAGALNVLDATPGDVLFPPSVLASLVGLGTNFSYAIGSIFGIVINTTVGAEKTIGTGTGDVLSLVNVRRGNPVVTVADFAGPATMRAQGGVHSLFTPALTLGIDDGLAIRLRALGTGMPADWQAAFCGHTRMAAPINELPLVNLP